MENSIIGVVMCGGKSTRMGTDKGMLKHNDLTWAEIAFEKLKQILSDVYLSVNQTQLSKYRRIFSEEKLIQDCVDIKGPLGGLLSIHNHFPHKDIFILACDMLDMDMAALSTLLGFYRFQPDRYDFYSYLNAGEFEPLTSIYTSKALSKVFVSYVTGQIREYSLKYLLENGNALTIAVNGVKFFNYNSKNDIPRNALNI